MDPCTLCRIASRDAPVPLLHEDDLVVAFQIPVGHEANRAPVHLLIIPKEHVKSSRELEPRHEPMLGRLITVAAKLAEDKGVGESGYRLLSNTGADANQTEFHLHLHCLGGVKLPPSA
jgi:histidine triad (HIT) family protein